MNHAEVGVADSCTVPPAVGWPSVAEGCAAEDGTFYLDNRVLVGATDELDFVAKWYLLWRWFHLVDLFDEEIPF